MRVDEQMIPLVNPNERIRMPEIRYMIESDDMGSPILFKADYTTDEGDNTLEDMWELATDIDGWVDPCDSVGSIIRWEWNALIQRLQRGWCWIKWNLRLTKGVRRMRKIERYLEEESMDWKSVSLEEIEEIIGGSL